MMAWDQQLPNLGEADPVGEPRRNPRLMRLTVAPAVAPRPSAAGMQRHQYGAQLLVGQRARRRGDPLALRHGDIPTHRFWIEPQTGRDALLRHTVPPEAEHFRDSTIVTSRYIHPPPASGWAGTGDMYPAVRSWGERS
jgi:hypothetical protein